MPRKPVCRLPAPPHPDAGKIERCGTHKGMTLCEGDRVQRTLRKFPARGTVMGVHMGADNRGRKMLAARVCFDTDEPGDLAYPFLFTELRKIR